MKFKLQFAPRDYFGIIMLLLVFPLASILPVQAGWENGLIANAQIVLLALGFLSSMDYGYYYFGKKAYAFGCLFLLMMARELSWGRVFFPNGKITEMGPEFISMHNIPGHDVINFFIGLAIFSVALFLYKSVDWKNFFKIPIPIVTLLIMIIAFFGQILSEKCLFVFLSHARNQIAEELFEAIIYFELLSTIQNYYSIEYIKDKSVIKFKITK